MLKLTHSLSALAALSVAGSASAVIVDGTRDASYGTALKVQTVQTGFGDEDGLADANGGELDALYATVEGGNLNIFVAGNLETDSFNKLSLFIDSKSGGENTLAVQDYDFADTGRNLGAITFAPGFNPDYHIFARAGGGNFEVDIVDRLGGVGSTVNASTGTSALSGDFGTASGVTDNSLTPNGSGVIGDAVSDGALAFALDNSNSAGVTGGSGAADAVAAAAVTTGAEFSIALSELGLGLGDTVSIVAGYSNGDYNFWSNQFLGGLPAPQDNLGADGAGNFIGDASTTALDLSGAMPASLVVPEPASLALLGLGGLAMLGRRRA